jgi:hypothetical protein
MVRCMALKLADLRAMSDDELIRTYDQVAENTMVGLDWYREELNRRVYERDAVAMQRLTLWTVRLAVVGIGVAIVALMVAVISLLH